MAADTSHQQPVGLTPAERQRLRRQRLKDGTAAPTCKGCGCKLQAGPGDSADRLAAGLCSTCWGNTPEGKQQRRERKAAGELTDKARERKRLWAAKKRAADRAARDAEG